MKCVNRGKTERAVAEILKPIRLQKAQQPVILKKHNANEFAIDTSESVGEWTFWT